jgi:hypothetical protein
MGEEHMTKPEKRTIRYSKIDPARMIEETQTALIADQKNDPIFRRSGKLVRLNQSVSDDAPDGILRKPTALIIREVVPDYLIVRIAEAAQFVVVGEDEDGKEVETPIAVPVPVVKHLIAAETKMRLPLLEGIVEAPTVNLANGTILSQPGYDPETGLWFDRRNLPLIPDFSATPTKDEANTALDLIKDLLKEFPFETGVDLSVAVAAILTAMVRRVIPTAPAFLIDAPSQSSGKTLLADLVGIIATGNGPGETQWADDTSEQRKAIGAILMSGDLIVKFDNCTKAIGGAYICSVVTAEYNYKDRILGVSERMDLPANVVWIFTGNNLTVKDDMATRAVRCRLDAQMEHPDEREFSRDLRVYAREKRGELIHAALTIIRAHIVAGLPGEANSRFKEWSTYIAGALTWLGMDDPATSRDSIVEDDPIREARRTLFDAWADEWGDDWVTAKQIGATSNEEINGRTSFTKTRTATYEAMIALDTAEGIKRGAGPSSIAARLKSVQGQIVDGRLLQRRAGAYADRGASWRLTRSAEAVRKEAAMMAEARADFAEPPDDDGAPPPKPSYAKPAKSPAT